MWLYKLKKFVSSLFYPAKCPYCNKILESDKTVCDECYKKFHVTPLTTDLELDYRHSIKVISAFPYREKIKELICKFKFKSNLDYVEYFAESMTKAIKQKGIVCNFGLITFVPMTKKHKKERGFNQAQILAKALGKMLDIPVENILLKVKNNKAQHTLHKSERAINVKGAYIAENKEKIKLKNILLCDDIVTTGSTIKECALALIDAGAKDVLGITIAKTEK